MELHARREGPSQIDPESWIFNAPCLSRPGNKEAMLALLYDYRTNLDRYAEWQNYFRQHKPPMLIVWGKNDVIFPAPGAQAYLRDLPRQSCICSIRATSHSKIDADEIAGLMRDFFDRKVPKG